MIFFLAMRQMSFRIGLLLALLVVLSVILWFMPKEGFQSYQNPYNMTSPSISQAYEFRLGKKSLTDEVLGFMNR